MICNLWWARKYLTWKELSFQFLTREKRNTMKNVKARAGQVVMWKDLTTWRTSQKDFIKGKRIHTSNTLLDNAFFEIESDRYPSKRLPGTQNRTAQLGTPRGRHQTASERTTPAGVSAYIAGGEFIFAAFDPCLCPMPWCLWGRYSGCN